MNRKGIEKKQNTKFRTGEGIRKCSDSLNKMGLINMEVETGFLSLVFILY